MHDRSLRKLVPGYVIPAGTQVVMKVSKVLPDDAGFKKPGSVGVVVESPSSNEKLYVVQFADGHTVHAYFHELSLRRQEVADELRDVSEDLRPFVIYCCIVGSKAYGLSTGDSDDDVRGIYLPPARLHWSLYQLPEQLESADDTKDEVYWELEKFLRLGLKANPNVLETLWTPLVLHADDTSRELRSIRGAFMSKHIYKTYSGYVLSQFRRMANTYKRTGSYKAKHAMHLVRLLHSGINAISTGEISIEVSSHRDCLLDIRSGKLSFDQVQKIALELDRRFQEAFENTRLPDQPDFKQVDSFLIRARMKMVD